MKNEKDGGTSAGILPFTILLGLLAWHLADVYYHGYGFGGQLFGVVLSAALGLIALFVLLPRDAEWKEYLANLLDRSRNLLLGFSALVAGGMHFLTFSMSSDVIPMFAFAVLVLAYYDLGALAVKSRPYLASPAIAATTASFMRDSMGRMGMVLALTFILSTAMLFAALLGVVGFTGVWTVLILAAILMFSLGMIVRASNI